MSLMPRRGVCFTCGHDHDQILFAGPSMERNVQIPIVQAEILLDLMDKNRHPIAHSKLEQAISIAKGKNE